MMSEHDRFLYNQLGSIRLRMDRRPRVLAARLRAWLRP